MTVATYRRLLLEAAGVGPSDLRRSGADVAERLEPRWPGLFEELEGIAAGAGQDVLELAAINARTELLAAGCSVVAHSDGSLAQTWDWHPDLAAATVTWTVHQPGGRSFTMATEAGILGKMGCTSTGLACGLNFLASSEDGGVEGVPIHVLLRLVLERCDRVDEALAAPRGGALGLGVHHAGRRRRGGGGRALAGRRRARPPGRRRVAGAQNHFLAGPIGGTDMLAAEQPGTFARRELLGRLVRRGVPVRDALGTHAPAEEPSAAMPIRTRRGPRGEPPCSPSPPCAAS